MMEPHYNPAAEAQAVDRIHRLGQKRPVKCVRYIMKDSFELKILELQKKKTELANLTFSHGKKLSKEQMSKQKLEVSLSSQERWVERVLMVGVCRSSRAYSSSFLRSAVPFFFSFFWRFTVDRFFFAAMHHIFLMG